MSLIRLHNRHINTVHVKEKPNKCRNCEKAFASSDVRNKHETIRTGERPFDTKICDKAFNLKRNLGRHILQVHTAVRKYTCQYCMKTFLTKQGYQKHERTHTG